jgi:hypothetical protein
MMVGLTQSRSSQGPRDVFIEKINRPSILVIRKMNVLRKSSDKDLPHGLSTVRCPEQKSSLLLHRYKPNNFLTEFKYIVFSSVENKAPSGQSRPAPTAHQSSLLVRQMVRPAGTKRDLRSQERDPVE